MDYDNLKINNGALIAWGCVIHKTLLADVFPPTCNFFFFLTKCEKVEAHTQAENTHVVIHKNARFPNIWKSTTDTCKTILIQK